MTNSLSFLVWETTGLKTRVVSLGSKERRVQPFFRNGKIPKWKSNLKSEKFWKFIKDFMNIDSLYNASCVLQIGLIHRGGGDCHLRFVSWRMEFICEEISPQTFTTESSWWGTGVFSVISCYFVEAFYLVSFVALQYSTGKEL